MLVDYPVNATHEVLQSHQTHYDFLKNQYTRTDPNEYSFGENSTEHSGRMDSPGRGRADGPQHKRKKSTTIPSGFDPKGHLKPSLQITQLKQRSSSIEKLPPNTTLDKIFGGSFKVVDVFSGTRDSSEEHFPEDPLTRRLSPRKQENFDIVEADEEDEDFKESRKGHRQKMSMNALKNDNFKLLKTSSYAQLNSNKAQHFDYLGSKKLPIADEKEASFRMSQKKFSPRQPEENKSNSSRNFQNESPVPQGTMLIEATGLGQKKLANHSKSRSKLDGFQNSNSSFHAKQGTKNTDSYVVLPPLNLRINDDFSIGVNNMIILDMVNENNEHKSLVTRGKRRGKTFFNTQTQFLRPNLDGYSPRGYVDILELKRTERENKFKSPSPVVDAEFRDDEMNLFEKYAGRFQLNLEERIHLPLLLQFINHLLVN